ncbi:hypothetical protein AVEN_148947-1 [Araneus ventricosus]|uniref:Uncharacterized protein n=1 Tax=Araneus ventricosus TaxID=182803 RepID=A0A4Y2FMD6_ARAVE|nr:hypothetical protein AVEN_148947-1 [Araneus ventricosus]
MIVFHFYGPIRRMENEQRWISRLVPGLHQFPSDIWIDEGFWHAVLQMKWNGLVVNVPRNQSGYPAAPFGLPAINAESHLCRYAEEGRKLSRSRAGHSLEI